MAEYGNLKRETPQSYNLKKIITVTMIQNSSRDFPRGCMTKKET